MVAVKPEGKPSIFNVISCWPSFRSLKSATTLNLRVLACISDAKATRLDPFRKTVTSELIPLTKYLLSLYFTSIGILVRVLV